MKTPITILLFLLGCNLVRGVELPVSTTEPMIVVAPDGWRSAKDQSPMAAAAPFDTFQITPPAGRNAAVLISVLGTNKPEFADPAVLKKILRADCRPYVSAPSELSKVEIKELKISGGLGFYANFVDPDLVGKPVKAGSYKTATPMILSIGTKTLVKATVLTDDLQGVDQREAMRIVESLKSK